MLRVLMLAALALNVALAALPRVAAAQPAAACGEPVLEFRETVLDESGTPLKAADGGPLWQPAMCAGADGELRQLTSAYIRVPVLVISDHSTTQPLLSFELNEEGSALLAQITARNDGRPLGIFADGSLLTAPVVRGVLRGRAVIADLSQSEAQALADRINASLAACTTP